MLIQFVQNNVEWLIFFNELKLDAYFISIK